MEFYWTPESLRSRQEQLCVPASLNPLQVRAGSRSVAPVWPGVLALWRSPTPVSGIDGHAGLAETSEASATFKQVLVASLTRLHAAKLPRCDKPTGIFITAAALIGELS